MRVALVTGAARGIGAAVVHRLLADGLHVAALDWCLGAEGPVGYPQGSRADLDRLAAADPDRVLPLVADVRHRSELDDAVRAVLDRFGRLDVVVAAAAVILGGEPAWKAPEPDLDLLWEVDAKGVWNTAAVTVPAMLSGPDPSGCRFVALSSAAADRGLFGLAGYVAVKHAVLGIVRGLAADLVGTGVTAVCVAPGSTATPMLAETARLYGLDAPEALAGHQLVRSLIDPDEVAAAVSFCASAEGRVVNGTTVHADGGFHG